MLLVTEALPERIAKGLLKQNIRFVEQFLSLMARPATVRLLAEVLNYPVEDLEAIASEVEREHPDLDVPRRSRADYYTGYGKKSDWERFS